jgi:hypothetical protein
LSPEDPSCLLFQAPKLHITLQATYLLFQAPT